MSEFMDWHKRATAVSTALYAEGDRRRLGAYSGFLYGVDSALTWAAEQEPTDAEIEAVARALFEDEVGPGNISYWGDWGDWRDADLRQYWRDSARAALLAAQKVRTGQ